METIADVVAEGRDREGAALATSGRGAPYMYGEFCTNVWKAGNLLSHYGVRAGAEMAVVVGPEAPDPGEQPGHIGPAANPLLAMLGGAALGATVDLTPADPVAGRAVVLPTAWLDRYEADPGCSRLGFGDQPEAADVTHWETDLWSENPIEPPDPVGAEDPFLRVDGTTHTQGELLAAATTVAEDRGLDEGSTVALDAPLTHAGTVVAGVLAPLSVGATILPEADAEDVSYVVRNDGEAGTGIVDPETVL